MSTFWNALAVTVVVAATSTMAQAQTAYTDPEVAYIAARLQEADFARNDQVCSERKYRKPLEAAGAAYRQANPAFMSALALPNPRAEVLEVVKRKISDYDKFHKTLLAMMASMPRKEICEEMIAKRPTLLFDKSLASTRDMLSRDKPPAPEPTLTTLAAADVDPIVAAVLQHPDVAMYLHPDAPGRVPVRVSVAAPYDKASLNLTLYGAAVKTAGLGDRGAVQLVLKPQGDKCQVEVRYAPEGIFGSVDLERVGGAWKAKGAKIYE